jgi:hypothetical protein
MPIGILFWGLVIIALVFNGMWWRNGVNWQYGLRGSGLLFFVLIFLLGWQVFGFILQGGRGGPF